MRKIHKKQIIEQITILKEAFNELKVQKADTSIILCSEIQDFIESIFNYVEKMIGKNSEISNLFKQLYEMVFKLTKSQIDLNEIYVFFQHIENEVLNLQPNKIEVVFFCYKSSMSDCLESIYFAAKNDPSCDAYFIPIPYFERKPNHDLGEMYFEGIEYYSDKYELTDWEKYDIETRRPDAIFIMNPYDEFNYVTSVHPNFYSKNLCKYTDILIYIPYFILSNNTFSENLVNSPAFIYSNKIIVQSNSVKKRYIETYNQKIGCKFGDPTKKIIALGSPKFDPIINSRKEDFSLPSNWNQIIKNQKIVLFNTTLSAALENTELFFKKLYSNFEYFKHNPDYILWWRPHPLLESTFKSMRNIFLQDYLNIISEYKSNGYGIYDDTHNLHRAIAWSDIYYGDFKSSVTPLYTITGKPIVLINNKNTEITNFGDDYKKSTNEKSFWDKSSISEMADGNCGSRIYNYIFEKIKKNN